MKQITIMIRQSPFNSGAAPEALRMAVGMLLADNRVRVILVENGVHLLAELEPEAINGPEVKRHLQTLTEFGCEIIAEQGAFAATGGIDSTGKAVLKSSGEIAELLCNHQGVTTVI